METFLYSSSRSFSNSRLVGPHSLGTLIEWKQRELLVLLVVDYVPTRWGH
jgi:hypothetical protein